MAENDQKDKTVEKVTGEVENTDKKENNEDRYEKVLLHLSQTGECDRKDDRSSEQYLRVSGLYAKKL